MAAVDEPPPRMRRGLRLGKYILQSRLGEGGFSQVWKAKDSIEGRSVALKIPHPFLPGSEAEEELLSEIQLSAKLDHPNILRIRNADKVGSLYVIASDLGIESLEERLQRRLAAKKALSFLEQMLLGAAFAHESRVLHRDLKPANLVIFRNDRLRIADFGLAKTMRHSVVSATGSGTIYYSAPEQMAGYPCFASDVFSLGLIAYQMFTAILPRWPFEWPFEGHKALRSKVPQELIGLIRKATRLNQKQRFHDAMEMLAAFERIRPALNKHFFPRPKTRRRQKKLGAWREIRFKECQKAFGKSLFLRFRCPQCDGPLSEQMASCPWCATHDFHFAEDSEFPHFCPRCKRGLRDEWRYCPWCWGPAFSDQIGRVLKDRRYRDTCSKCREPVMDGMRYCPWCHAKAAKPVRIESLPDKCRHCKGSVVAALWDHCPWCSKQIRRRSSV